MVKQFCFILVVTKDERRIFHITAFYLCLSILPLNRCGMSAALVIETSEGILCRAFYHDVLFIDTFRYHSI